MRSSPPLRWLFETRAGDIVMGQRPNPPLIAAVVLSLVGFVVHLPIVVLLTALAWGVWAALELFAGVNPFRRIMGLVVLAVTVLSYAIGR